MSLRRRVFAYVAGAALASCLLTVGVAVVLVRHRVAVQRMSALVREADVLATVGGGGALRPGEHVYRLGTGRARQLGPRASDLILARIPNVRSSRGTLTVHRRSLMFVARATPAGGIVLVRSAALAFGEWRPFLGSLLLAGLGGALLAAALSYLLTRRLIRPIATLVSATGQVAAGREQVSVPVEGDDELGELGRSFNRMSESLALARGAQRSFLESVSHELKTPLTSIRGYAEALGDGAVSAEQAAAVIEGEAGRLERLVADLLNLARLQRAEFHVDHVPVDLADLATRSVERHRPHARELGVILSCELEPAATGVGDPDRLVQAASNLIENALRATPAGGTVTVRAEPGVISVADTGPGLAPEDLPRAFERFYLYDRYRSERPVGSGLGLAIVRELAERMGGQVEVDSALGRGTKFSLMVPRQ